MISTGSLAAVLALAGLAQSQCGGHYDPYYPTVPLVSDISVISRYWGQVSPYSDNPENYFGVQNVGLPKGCGIEQVHTLQRHAQRFPTSAFDDGANDEIFGKRIANWTKANPSKQFTGPLAFLNTYQYIMSESYLTGIGAKTEFEAGVSFWNRYGRILYNATAGQLAYNASFPNGTARPKPVLRTTSQSRIWNSAINWALGFFGTSFQITPDPTLANATSPFNVVVIPEGGTENNTLASYDSCIKSAAETIWDMGDLDLEYYLPVYLGEATQRLQNYAPAGFNFTVNDTYAMQSLCAYETAYIGESQFCGLFTLDEWAGFENTLDTEYYYDYAWGNPTGRAQGIGYLQELTARLTNQLITSSDSSINYTITNNTDDFPLGQKFYADVTHDDIIVSLLTAMSVDYFRDPPSLSQWPPNPNRRFILSRLTPFGARLITEVVGCSSANPTASASHLTLYSPTANGYNASNATHKFIRMRLNNGVVPLSTIRGGGCAGRTDGLCALDKFLQSQSNATALANYQFSCFGNWTLSNATSGADLDGTIFK